MTKNSVDRELIDSFRKPLLPQIIRGIASVAITGIIYLAVMTIIGKFEDKELFGDMDFSNRAIVVSLVAAIPIVAIWCLSECLTVVFAIAAALVEIRDLLREANAIARNMDSKIPSEPLSPIPLSPTAAHLPPRTR